MPPIIFSFIYLLPIHIFVHSLFMHFTACIHLSIHLSIICLFIHLFTNSFVHSFIGLSIHLFIYLQVHACIHLFNLSIHLFTCSFIHSLVHPSIHLFIHSFVRAYIQLSIYPSISLSICLSIHLFTCSFIHSLVPFIYLFSRSFKCTVLQLVSFRLDLLIIDPLIMLQSSWRHQIISYYRYNWCLVHLVTGYTCLSYKNYEWTVLT